MDKNKQKWLIIGIGLIALFYFMSQQQTVSKEASAICKDTDGGNTPNTYGIVTTFNGKYADKCIGTARLTEYFCKPGVWTNNYNQIGSQTYDCTCSNGACKQTSPPKQTTCSDGTKIGECSIKQSGYRCTQPICITTPCNSFLVKDATCSIPTIQVMPTCICPYGYNYINGVCV